MFMLCVWHVVHGIGLCFFRENTKKIGIHGSKVDLREVFTQETSPPKMLRPVTLQDVFFLKNMFFFIKNIFFEFKKHVVGYG